MRWLRNHIRQGSGLALFALALNLVLSFGHVHAPRTTDDAPAKVVVASSAHAAVPAHDEDGDASDELCSICLAMAALSSAVAAPPPVLAAVPVVRVATAQPHDRHAAAISRTNAFWSRGPPIS